MKRFFVTFFLLFILISSKAQITWDGEGGDGQWITASNWVGDIVPGISDDVLLDNSFFLTSYVVTLPGGAVTVSVNSLTITPSAGVFITFDLPSSNTADPGFIAIGPGDALVLNDRAAFFNSSGALTGTGVAITNTFRINNGGRYIHHTARGNATIVSQLSIAAGTELGQFEYDVPTGSYGISVTGRTYGTLILLSFANGGAVTYTAPGSTECNVKGNLEIYSGVTFSLSMSANLNISGNLTQASSSTFNLQSTNNPNIVKVAGNLTVGGTITESGSGLPVLELNGTTNQQISVTGSIINTIGFTINNSAGATLTNPLTIPYNLNLTLGKITTTSTNLLTMVDNSIITGGSAFSFVDGPLKKIGDESFIFPVGKGSMYATIGTAVVTGGAVTDEYTAEYFRINPQSIYGTNYAPGIDHISYVEYWTLQQNAGTATARIVINVHQNSFCLQPATTFISRSNGVGLMWTIEPATATGIGGCGLYQCFNLTSNADVSGFGTFTLATSDPFSVNPLPIKLINFDVVKVNSNLSNLTWELAACCSSAARFEVEKSIDGRNFSLLTIVPGSETNRFYTFNDNRLYKGINYYRLKMVDVGGIVSYSKVVAIINDNHGIVITSLSPNPVHSNAFITVSTGRSSLVDFKVYNMSGVLLKQWQSNIAEGNNIIDMNVAGLPAGMYSLFVSNKSANSVSPFIKQ